MSFCIRCGKSLGPDDQFCMNCGSKVFAENEGPVVTDNRDVPSPSPTLPEKVEIPEGSGKGGQFEAVIWMMRIAFVVILILILSNISATFRSPISGILTVLVCVMLFIGPELITHNQRKQLVRVRVSKDEIVSDEFRSFFGLKKESIRFASSNIDRIETIYVSQTTMKISSSPESGAIFNAMVFYLKDGRIFTFTQRDHTAICTARKILEPMVASKASTVPSVDDVSYQNKKIKNNIDRRFDQVMIIGMSLLVIYMIYTMLDLALTRELTPFRLFFIAFFFVIILVISIPMYIFYRTSSAKEVEFKDDGIQITTLFGERMIRWDEIKEIRLGPGAGASNTKDRKAVISLGKRKNYVVTYDIGVIAKQSYEKRTGHAPPTREGPELTKFQEAKVQEMDIIQKERPDLARKKQLTSYGWLISFVMFLVAFVTDLLFVFLLAIAIFIFLFYMGKRTDAEIKRYMEWKWTNQQPGNNK